MLKLFRQASLRCCLCCTGLVLAIALVRGHSFFADLPFFRLLYAHKISVKAAVPRPTPTDDSAAAQEKFFVKLPAPKPIAAADHRDSSSASSHRAGPMPGLIFDLGFNDGADAALYLQHGYSVVAVEANPLLVKEGNAKFAGAIADGRLKLLSVGIASDSQMDAGRGGAQSKINSSSAGVPAAGVPAAGVPAAGATFLSARPPKLLPFYVHKELHIWSSFDKSWGCRIAGPPEKAGPGPYCDVVEVPLKPCLDLYAEYGVPWLLKLDFESPEGQQACIAALHRVRLAERPRYIIDAEQDNILTLIDLGYTRFKLVCQEDDVKAVDWGHSSGPFGEFGQDAELKWKWRVFDTTKADAIDFARELLRAGLRAPAEDCRWWDIHAAMPVDDQRSWQVVAGGGSRRGDVGGSASAKQ